MKLYVLCVCVYFVAVSDGNELEACDGKPCFKIRGAAAVSRTALGVAIRASGWSAMQQDTVHRYFDVITECSSVVSSVQLADLRLGGSVMLGMVAHELRHLSFFLADLSGQLFSSSYGLSSCGIFDRGFISDEEWNLLFDSLGKWMNNGPNSQRSPKYVMFQVRQAPTSQVGEAWQEYTKRLHKLETSDNVEVDSCVAVAHPLVYACPHVGDDVCEVHELTTTHELHVDCIPQPGWTTPPPVKSGDLHGTTYLTRLSALVIGILGSISLLDDTVSLCILNAYT